MRELSIKINPTQRRNNLFYLFEIIKEQKKENRSETIRKAIDYAFKDTPDYKLLRYHQIFMNKDIEDYPQYIQLKVDIKKWDKIQTDIKQSLDLKELNTPQTVRFLLMNYINVIGVSYNELDLKKRKKELISSIIDIDDVKKIENINKFITYPTRISLDYYERYLKEVYPKCRTEESITRLTSNLIEGLLGQRKTVLNIENLHNNEKNKELFTAGGLADIAVVKNNFEYGKKYEDEEVVTAFIEVKALGTNDIDSQCIKDPFCFEKGKKFYNTTFKNYILTNGNVFIFYKVDWKAQYLEEVLEIELLEKNGSINKIRFEELERYLINTLK